MTDLWTTTEVAQYLGATSVRSVSKTLHRLGIRPVARQPGRAGQNLYDAEEVKRKAAGMPGQGARSDLKADDDMLTGTTTVITRNGHPAARIAPLEDTMTATADRTMIVTNLERVADDATLGVVVSASAADADDMIRLGLEEWAYTKRQATFDELRTVSFPANDDPEAWSNAADRSLSENGLRRIGEWELWFGPIIAAPIAETFDKTR